MRILVAGGAGQFGRCLAEAGAERGGCTVHLASRAEVDLLTPETILPALDAHAPDLVVNAAAYTAVDGGERDRELAFSVNADGAGALARAAGRAGVPLVQLSTDYVFGAGTGPRDEAAPALPLNVYGRSKLAGERAVAEAGGRHMILRTAWLYSAHGRNFVKTMARLSAGSTPVRVVADQLGSPTDALALADGLLILVSSWSARAFSGPSLFHLAGSGHASWHGLARVVWKEAEALSRAVPPLVRVTAAEFGAAAPRPADSRLDCAAIAAAYGIALPPWEERTRTLARRLLAPAAST